MKMEENNNQCFVIMPISDPKDYEQGHFKCVYEDILIPAIEEAGYIPKRADDDKSSSMIQVNIIQDIIESPMAICDLSSRNPNVLFELGIRQAFDLPVVLVQEEGTPRIFDISTINTIDYRKTLLYRDVIEDREKIKEAILQTKDNTRGINSIIRLLGGNPAKKKEGIDDNALLYTMSNQIQNIMNKLYDLENININGDEIKVYRQKRDEGALIHDNAYIRRFLKDIKDRIKRASTIEEMIDGLSYIPLAREEIYNCVILALTERTRMLNELEDLTAITNSKISDMREV